MLFLAANGFRVIAHDRRGHGRSTQTWNGNDMDTYADDLADRDRDARSAGRSRWSGFSTGGGEVARYIGRHGTGRVAKVVLVSAVPPFMLRTEDNPGGVPIEVFDGLRAGSLADRSQTYRDLADGPFFGANRQGANPSRRNAGRLLVAGACRPATATPWSASPPSPPPTSGRTSTGSMSRPSSSTATTTRWCRSRWAAQASAARISGAVLKVYPGAPHGITDTHKEELSADLLTFLRTRQRVASVRGVVVARGNRLSCIISRRSSMSTEQPAPIRPRPTPSC